MPEGSPVYTSEGVMYDTRRRQGAGRTAPPQGRRPASPPPKKKKTFNKDRFFLHVKTFFIRLAVMLLIVSILGVWWFRAEFYSSPEGRGGKVSVSLLDEYYYESRAADCYFSDVLYIDFTSVAEWFGMVSVGSVGCMRFICADGTAETSSGKGGEEYAIFTDGSTTVLVNGTVVILEAECRTENSHIWIPLSFVENYVSGVECKRSAKGSEISFIPEGWTEPEEGEEDEELVINAAFKVKAQNALAHVEYPS